MMLIILKKGKLMPSKFSGNNQRVTFKPTDEQEHKYYYLNITDDVRDKWSPFISEGNVLNCEIKPGSNNVNKYGQFQVEKDLSKVKEN